MSTVNLIHAGLFLLYCVVLASVAGNVRVKKLRNFSSIIQLTVVLICVDLLIGFFVIEQMYGSTPSASWIAKSIYMIPILILGAGAWMLRAHRRHQARSEAQENASDDPV